MDLTLESVQCDRDRAASIHDDLLDVQADRLVRRRTQVEVAGHASSTGTEVRNIELSQQRAEAVRVYLVERGVDGEMVSAKGYGDSDPIATNETAGGRRANQRIELRFEY